MGSTPNLVPGQIPTAEAWNGFFQVKADDILFTGDSGTGGVKGLVPPPPAGAAAAGYVLLASGVWGPVAGGGGGGGGNLESYQYVVPLTGDTVVMLNVINLVLNPAGELATLTVDLPPSPADKQICVVSTTQGIDSMVINPGVGGGTVHGSPPILTANGGVGFIWIQPQTAWFRRF